MQRYDHLCTYPENKDALRSLAGYRLMILSNGTPLMLAAVVKNCGLEGVFERLISVRQLGVYKPDPRVYQLACTAAGLQPEEIAFVSSNYFNIAGAASFGFRTFWINRRGEQPDLLGAGASAVLDSLAQLPDVITTE
jgi:2-haloacid dehalogenase